MLGISAYRLKELFPVVCKTRWFNYIVSSSESAIEAIDDVEVGTRNEPSRAVVADRISSARCKRLHPHVANAFATTHRSGSRAHHSP